MRKYFNIIATAALIAAVFAFAGCRNHSSKAKADPSANKYAMPEVPAMVTDTDEVLDYLTAHYWDKFISADRPGAQDTSLVMGFTHEAFEEIFYQYALLLRAAKPETGLKSGRAILNSVENWQKEHPESTLWANFTDMYYHILQDPNSPWRNEEYCIPLIEKRLSSPFSTEEQKIRAEKELPRFNLNRLGEKAADFAFTLRNGRPMRLYDIDAEYTILFFSNPGCPNCREVMESLQSLPGIDALIANKQLAVANIYPDEDLGEWIKYSEIYPKNWLNGYDHLLAVNNTPLYNLRAIPSVYLLDKEKRVILKDVPTDFLISYMEQFLGR